MVIVPSEEAAKQIRALPPEPERHSNPPLMERVYQNHGNPSIVGLLDENCRRILDVGCGSGDNASLIHSKFPKCEVYGITLSPAEAELARMSMVACWVHDIEGKPPDELHDVAFDAIVFSHVLEHVREPAKVVASFVPFLRGGGQVVMAVPNVLFAPMRLQFLRGDFEYHPEGGILDDTHLHFYTYFTADQYLLSESACLRQTAKSVSGHIPLSFLRGRIIPNPICKKIDQWGTRHWPNLFGEQILVVAEKA